MRHHLLVVSEKKSKMLKTDRSCLRTELSITDGATLTFCTQPRQIFMCNKGSVSSILCGRLTPPRQH